MSRRHLISLDLLQRAELEGLIQRGLFLKHAANTPTLQGKTLAMLFAKASTRTRVSFEVGMFQLGGHALMLSSKDSQVGRGEAVKDTAQVLSRYVDGIMIRTYDHQEVIELAQYSTVPIINALTDLTHPCQILADLMTCVENYPDRSLSELVVTWVGDGNNMAHSWINAAGVLGFELRLACPDGFTPDTRILEAARHGGARVRLTQSPLDAADDAHVVTTDVWASMGQEDEAQQRARAFAGFQVNAEMMKRAAPDAIFLHCLPAHRGEEVTAEVIDGPQSRIYDEAENRLHVQKAVMEWCMGGIDVA